MRHITTILLRAIVQPAFVKISWNRYSHAMRLRLLMILGVLLISACDTLDNSEATPPKSERIPVSAMALQQPADCTDFKAYVTSSLVKRHTYISPYPYYGCSTKSGPGGPGVPVPVADGVDMAPPSTNTGGTEAANPAPAPDDVSQTNNQENGVDESDSIKAHSKDGTLFIGHGSYLIIAKAFPPQGMSKLSETDLGEHIHNLAYDETNDRIIVMSRYQTPIGILNSTAVDTKDFAPEPLPVKNETTVSIYNVSDRANPLLLERISIDGWYQNSRTIEDRLHLITNYYAEPVNFAGDKEFTELVNNFHNAVNEVACADPANYDPEKAQNDPAVIEAKDKLTIKITAAVENVDPASYLPKARQGAADAQTEIGQFLQCTDVYHPEIKSTLGMQVITSMNTDGSNVAASAIVNNSWLNYSSKTHLYLAERSEFWWWGQINIDQTAIHKFAISTARPQYLATGVVDGYANNSFSLSEYQSHLRIATTHRDFTLEDPATGIWRRELKNHLSVLKDDDKGTLIVTGEVRDIAKGETIRSVRFLGDRGFIVTFRNMDPLFTFDLSDATNPLMLGELVIPGFSTYMHPFDDNHLLTVGRAGGANGTGLSNDVQIQLIDVTDMAKPKVISRFTPDLPSGSSWSEAAYDHHAFTYYAPANLLAIPMQIYPFTSADLPFTGVMAFSVTVEGGIKPIGRVDHSDLAKQYYCIDNQPKAGLISYCDNGRFISWASPRRSVVMTSDTSVYLYTISDVGLKAGEIADLSTTLGSMIFPPQYYPWYPFEFTLMDMVDPPLQGGI